MKIKEFSFTLLIEISIKSSLVDILTKNSKFYILACKVLVLFRKTHNFPELFNLIYVIDRKSMIKAIKAKSFKMFLWGTLLKS